MQNIIERIADLADIDSRRALGFPPRKLNSNFELKLVDELFLYYTRQKKLVYFNVAHDFMYWEVTEDITPINIDENTWMHGDDSQSRIFIWKGHPGRLTEDMVIFPSGIYTPVGRPIFIDRIQVE
jgi:hypothetical protein